MISKKDRAAAAQKTGQEVGMATGTLSDLSGHQDPLEGLLKHRLPGPTRGPEHPGFLQDPRDACAPGLGTHV